MDDIALNAIIDDLYALYDRSENMHVAVEAEKAAPIAHGWYTRVRRTGRALQVLTANGFGRLLEGRDGYQGEPRTGRTWGPPAVVPQSHDAVCAIWSVAVSGESGSSHQPTPAATCTREPLTADCQSAPSIVGRSCDQILLDEHRRLP